METVVLRPGDGVLTRRIKKRCKEIGFDVEEERRWNGFGYEVTGYQVPLNIYEDEKAHRDKENAGRQKREEAEREELNRQFQELRIKELKSRFPQLSPEQIASIDDHRVFTPEQLGYQFGHGTKSYWERLGYRVVGKPSGVVVRGSRIHRVFDRCALTEEKASISVEALWKSYCQRFGSRIALAEAIRLANRLQKVKRIKGFYDLKDEWIRFQQDNLIEGRIARHEKKLCWTCDGEGFDADNDEECWECGGTGIFSSRTLYEHRFEIEGNTYTFHSYIRPHQVSEEKGVDERHYGRPFTSDELPLPPQSHLVQMVRMGLTELIKQAAG